MRTPRAKRPEPSQIGPLAIVALAAVVLLVALAAGGGTVRLARRRRRAELPPRRGAASLATSARRWRSVAAARRAQGAVARRARRRGRRYLAGDVEERRWTEQVLSEQREVIQRLALQGIVVRPDFTFGRVLQRILGRARPARRVPPRSDARSAGPLSGARGVPRRGEVHRIDDLAPGSRRPRPAHGASASPGVASRSRSSTRGSTASSRCSRRGSGQATTSWTAMTRPSPKEAWGSDRRRAPRHQARRPRGRQR